jgi:hypothetical protein
MQKFTTLTAAALALALSAVAATAQIQSPGAARLRANSKRHADRQRRRLPRLWAILPAGHDPALRTLPLLVRPLLLTPASHLKPKARLDVLFSTAMREG